MKNKAISIIDKIAFETNILSLNTTTKVAICGEARKGFDIAIQEVKKLANRLLDAFKRNRIFRIPNGII